MPMVACGPWVVRRSARGRPSPLRRVHRRQARVRGRWDFRDGARDCGARGARRRGGRRAGPQARGRAHCGRVRPRREHEHEQESQTLVLV